MRNGKRTYLSIWMLTLVAVLLAVAGTDAVAAPKKFARKECMDCHTKFADKYSSLKYVHTIVKENKCEECHLRHGIVAKLLLKKDGNQVCYSCHSKEKIGLTKKTIHAPLKVGKCSVCHNSHASAYPHLLKSEGNAVCYQCHKKDDFEKKNVHKVLQKDGCLACHSSHSSDEQKLLSKAEPQLCLGCHDSKAASFKKA